MHTGIPTPPPPNASHPPPSGFLTPNANTLVVLYKDCHLRRVSSGISNGNDIETKANESFDNGVFFDIKRSKDLQ